MPSTSNELLHTHCKHNSYTQRLHCCLYTAAQTSLAATAAHGLHLLAVVAAWWSVRICSSAAHCCTVAACCLSALLCAPQVGRRARAGAGHGGCARPLGAARPLRVRLCVAGILPTCVARTHLAALAGSAAPGSRCSTSQRSASATAFSERGLYIRSGASAAAHTAEAGLPTCGADAPILTQGVPGGEVPQRQHPGGRRVGQAGPQRGLPQRQDHQGQDHRHVRLPRSSSPIKDGFGASWRRHSAVLVQTDCFWSPPLLHVDVSTATQLCTWTVLLCAGCGSAAVHMECCYMPAADRPRPDHPERLSALSIAAHRRWHPKHSQPDPRHRWNPLRPAPRVCRCPCKYPNNAASNARWCCGDYPHLDMSQFALEKVPLEPPAS